MKSVLDLQHHTGSRFGLFGENRDPSCKAKRLWSPGIRLRPEIRLSELAAIDFQISLWDHLIRNSSNHNACSYRSAFKMGRWYLFGWFLATKSLVDSVTTSFFI